MTPRQINNLVISVEFGNLCIRTPEQHLLWSKKISELPIMGFSLQSILKELNAGMAILEKEKAYWEKPQDVKLERKIVENEKQKKSEHNLIYELGEMYSDEHSRLFDDGVFSR